MGIYHFATVGRWPGAVTAGLAYLKHEYLKDLDERKQAADEEDHQREQHDDDCQMCRDVIEYLVLFTTSEVQSGALRPSEIHFNDYCKPNYRKTLKAPKVTDVIIDFVEAELIDLPSDKDGHLCGCKAIYCYELGDLSDYDSCFETFAKAVLHFSPLGGVGKNIQANLTGGTNVMNAAIHQTASLSGLISRLYYTFMAEQDQQKFLQPTSDDPLRFRFVDVPMIKTAIDPVYDELLNVLLRLEATGNQWHKDVEILKRLQDSAPMTLPEGTALRVMEMEIDVFKREYLNKLDGISGILDREHQHSSRVRISDIGKEQLKTLRNPLYRALIERGLGKFDNGEDAAEKIKELTDDMKIDPIWER